MQEKLYFKIAIFPIFVFLLLLSAFMTSAANMSEISHIKTVTAEVILADQGLKTLIDDFHANLDSLCIEDRKGMVVDRQVGPLLVSIDCDVVKDMSSGRFRDYFIGKLVKEVYFADSRASLTQLSGLGQADTYRVAMTLFSSRVHKQLAACRSILIILLMTLAFIMIKGIGREKIAFQVFGSGIFVAGLIGWLISRLTITSLVVAGAHLPPRALLIMTRELDMFFQPANRMFVAGSIFIVMMILTRLIDGREAQDITG